MSYLYHRKNGKMYDLWPIQVDAILQLFCEGRKFDIAHERITLGELVRVKNWWEIGTPFQFVPRLFTEEGELVDSLEEERNFRNSKFAELANVASLTAEKIGSLDTTQKLDDADINNTYWDRELLLPFYRDEKIVVIATCPIPSCALSLRVRKGLYPGEFLDKAISKKVYQVSKGKKILDGESYSVGETLAPVWEMSIATIDRLVGHEER